MSHKVKKDTIIVLGSGIYARPFQEFGKIQLVQGYCLPDELDWNTIKLVVFTGGADVDPTMYEDDKHPSTYSDIHRDKMEAEFYMTALTEEVPMAGICRGSQFLTVMNGGSLVQNVDSHAIAGTHAITTEEGDTVQVTSTHHQMMFPKGKYKILAWANGLSSKYEFGKYVARNKEKEPTQEPEAVWYEDTLSLAVQFHPEYMPVDSLGYMYYQSLIKDYLV